jgi:small subunit ribosomal protein S2
MLVPTVALVDTDCDPSLITYPVPGNDDSISSIKLFLDLVGKAISLGRASRVEQPQSSDEVRVLSASAQR